MTKLIKFFNTLNNKINEYDEYSKFLVYKNAQNPFNKPYYSTFVWVDKKNSPK
ncbi:MAG: hypothetical protein MJ229_05150 [bacterium]|nr:hypothetical protein [bacterium]